ncbi:MAG: cupin domain-containing protein [Mucilaginibacter sp.]
MKVMLLFSRLSLRRLAASSFLVVISIQGFSQSKQPYILEHEKDIAKNEQGTHNGGGSTVGYSFFANANNLKMTFRKRVLHPGSAIGYHLQKEDEVYYIISGTGEMRMNGKAFPVKAGDAILTRPGSSHGLKQRGKDDLVIIIAY